MSSSIQTNSSDSGRKRKSFSSEVTDSWNVGDSRKRINSDCLAGNPFVEEEHETNESEITDEKETQSISRKSSKISTGLTLFDESWVVGSGRNGLKFDFLEPKSLRKSSKRIDLSGFQGRVEETESVSTELKLCEDPWEIKKPFTVQDQEIETNNILKSDLLGPKKFTNVREKIDLSGFQNRPEEAGSVSTELKLYEDPWKIKKMLTKSDCSDNLHRLMFSKVAIERHVKPQLKKKHGITDEDIENGIDLRVWDYDSKTEHVVTFKKWVSNKSYIFGSNWKSQFVDRRELLIGDEIGLFWDDNELRFGFRVLSRAPAQ